MNQRRLERFHATLVDAQRERDYLPLSSSLDEPYWNTYEMMVMWLLVNKLREAYDRPMLPFEAVKRVEQSASGHFDYTKKFALYCAELVDAES